MLTFSFTGCFEGCSLLGLVRWIKFVRATAWLHIPRTTGVLFRFLVSLTPCTPFPIGYCHISVHSVVVPSRVRFVLYCLKLPARVFSHLPRVFSLYTSSSWYASVISLRHLLICSVLDIVPSDSQTSQNNVSPHERRAGSDTTGQLLHCLPCFPTNVLSLYACFPSVNNYHRAPQFVT